MVLWTSFKEVYYDESMGLVCSALLFVTAQGCSVNEVEWCPTTVFCTGYQDSLGLT